MELESHSQPCSTFKKRSLSESYLRDGCGIDFPFRKISVDDSYLILTSQNDTRECPLEIADLTDIDLTCPDDTIVASASTGMSLSHSVNRLGINEMHPFALELTSNGNANFEVISKLPLGESNLNITMASCGTMCRICLEGDGQEELISPCKCSGSLALIHKSCLEKWLNLSNCDTCELCRYVFTVDRTPKPFWQLALCNNRELRRSVAIDFLCFMILTPLVAMSLYLCVSTAIFYKNNAENHEKVVPIHLEPSYWKAWEVQQILRDHRNLTAKTEGNESSKTGPAWDIIGLSLLAVILVAIYLSWLIAAAVYYTRILRVWRHANQELVLSENHRRPSCFSVLSNTYQQMEEVDNHENISPVISSHGTIPRIHVEDADLPNPTNSVDIESRRASRRD